MYIDCVNNNGQAYLRIAESYSVKIDGQRKNRKRTIKNIGPLHKYDDGQPNYLQRLKQSFKEGKPIIESLESYCVDRITSRITVNFDREDKESSYSEPKNIGYFLLDGLYDTLVHRN